MKKILFVGICLSILGCSQAHTQTCQEAIQQTKNAFYQGDYLTVKSEGVLALQCLEASQTLAQKEILEVLHHLGLAEIELQDYSKAQKYLERAYTEAKAFYQTEEAKSWKHQLDLGECYHKSGQYGQALSIFEALYVSVLAQSPEKRSFYEAEAQRQLAEVYQALGKFAKARGYYYSLVESAFSVGEVVDWQSRLLKLSMLEANYTQADSLLKAMKINLQTDSTTEAKDWIEFFVQQAGFWQELGRYDNAHSTYEIAWQQLQDNNGNLAAYQPLLLNNWASLYQKKAQFIWADSLLKEAGLLTEAIYQQDSPQMAVALFSQGNSKQLQGKYTEALDFYTQAMRINAKYYGEERSVRATDLANLALLYQALADFGQADSLMQQVLLIEQNTLGLQHPRFARSLLNYANLLADMGAYSLADSLQRQALKTLEVIFGKEHPDYQVAENNYASLKTSTGEYAEAEGIYLNLQSRQAELFGTNHPNYASTLQNLASLLTLLGQFERAERLYEESTAIYLNTLGNQHPDYLNTQHNLAFLYQRNQKIAEAKKIYEQILPIEAIVYGQTHPNYANALNDFAWLYVQLDDYNTADSLYQQALKIREIHFGTSHLLYAKTLRNLGNLAEYQNQYTQALEYYEKSLAVFENQLSEQHTQFAETLNDLARITYKINDVAKANKLYQRVYQTTQNLIKNYLPYLNEAEKESFYLNTLRNFLSSYQQFALLAQENNPKFVEQLLNLTLNTKGLLLEGQKEIRAKLNTETNPLLKEKLNTWYNLKNQLANLYREYEVDFKKIDSLETAATLLEKELITSSSNFAQTFEQKTYTWQQIQAKLKKNEVAIEILRVEMKELTNKQEIWYAFLLISKDKTPQLILMKNGTDLDRKAYRNYKNKVQDKVSDVLSYDFFWKALAPHVENYQKIYLSADGVYHLISLNGIYNPEKESYLIEYLDIHALNNLRDLLINTTQKQNPVVHLFGYPIYANLRISPLPNTEVEVKKIAKLFEANSIEANYYIQKESTESAIKKLKKPYLLHIATHGYFSPKDDFSNAPVNPLHRAGLLLTPSSLSETSISNEQIADDGYLTAYEVMNLDLQGCEMVVLSACETGLGELQSFEGVYGLQRAFQVAGTDTILMSLWTVNDEATLDLMTEFYTLWQQGLDKRTAFRKAQMKVREEYKYPYFWSAFVMLGK